MGVKDQGARLLPLRGGGWDAVHDRIEHRLDPLAGLGGDLQYVLFVHAKELGQLLHRAGHIGHGEVDLVQDRDDLEVLLHGQVEVGEGLRLDPLARVHN